MERSKGRFVPRDCYINVIYQCCERLVGVLVYMCISMLREIGRSSRVPSNSPTLWRVGVLVYPSEMLLVYQSPRCGVPLSTCFTVS